MVPRGLVLLPHGGARAGERRHLPGAGLGAARARRAGLPRDMQDGASCPCTPLSLSGVTDVWGLQLHENQEHPDVPLLEHAKELIAKLEAQGIQPSPEDDGEGEDGDDAGWEDVDGEDEDVEMS